MPLTTRTNGSGGSNIITSTWFNDFKDVLTGVMVDQEITIKNTLALNAIGASPTAAAAGSLAAGTTLGIGVYKYVYTYVGADGESAVSPLFSITTTSTNQKVNLTGITVGPSGTVSRKVYRTAVGGAFYKLLTTIADNTTTTFSDSVADGSLGALIPGYNSFGGTLFARDSAGTTRGGVANDGTFIEAMSPITVTGGTAGTAEIYEWVQGTLKITWVVLNGFRTAGSDQIVQLPQAYTKGALVRGIGFLTTAFLNNGSTTTIQVYNSGVTAGAASVGTGSNLFADNQGYIASAFDSIRFNSGWASNKDGVIKIEGK